MLCLAMARRKNRRVSGSEEASQRRRHMGTYYIDYIPKWRSFADGDFRVSKTKNAIELANDKRDAGFARRLDELLKWVDWFTALEIWSAVCECVH